MTSNLNVQLITINTHATCRECGCGFTVFIDKVPERGGCYCPECGEYNPYAWGQVLDEKVFTLKEIKKNIQKRIEYIKRKLNGCIGYSPMEKQIRIEELTNVIIELERRSNGN